MKRITIFLAIITIMMLIGTIPLWAQMISNITEDVDTEFGIYHPYLVEITPQAAQYTVEPDFSNVFNFNEFEFSEADR
ncbi:hypothetical protein KJ656_05330, partial [bacterium]|nr:hypothetical protein [bacterium]